MAAKKNKCYCGIGGQAVLEGVMKKRGEVCGGCEKTGW